MRTLNISISDFEYNKFGIKSESLSFNEFLEIVRREIAKINLRKSVELAEKYKLADMSPEEIDSEVKSVRDDAKSRH